MNLQPTDVEAAIDRALQLQERQVAHLNESIPESLRAEIHAAHTTNTTTANTSDAQDEAAFQEDIRRMWNLPMPSDAPPETRAAVDALSGQAHTEADGVRAAATRELMTNAGPVPGRS